MKIEHRGSSRSSKSLQPELERLTDDRVQAHLLFRDAESLLGSVWSNAGHPGMPPERPDPSTWREAERLASQALQLYPALPNARRTVGLKFADAVKALVGAAAGRDYHWIRDAHDSALAAAAIIWLEASRIHGEDLDGEVSVALALMYGASGQYDPMLRQILQVLDETPGLRPRLREPGGLMLFVLAVDDEPDQEQGLQRLCTALALPLHLQRAAFERSVAGVSFDKEDGVYWLAIARREYWQNEATHPMSPLLVLVWVSEEQGVRLTRACVFPARYTGSNRIEIPKEERLHVPPAQLYERLNEQFLLVAEADKSYRSY